MGGKTVAFASRTLKAAERNYAITEQECLVIFWTRKISPVLKPATVENHNGSQGNGTLRETPRERYNLIMIKYFLINFSL